VAVGAVILGALSLAGCGADAPGDVERTVAQGGVPADVSAHQQQVIERFEVTGEVSFDDYRQANLDNIACLTDLGFEVDPWITSEPFGQPVLLYGFTASVEMVEQFTLDGLDVIMRACDDFNLGLVDALYSQNPASVQWGDQDSAERYALFAPAVIACLAGYGVSVPADAEPDEWMDAADELFYTNDSTGPDCLVETGFTEAATTVINLG